jgi:hypothetical protein
LEEEFLSLSGDISKMSASELVSKFRSISSSLLFKRFPSIFLSNKSMPGLELSIAKGAEGYLLRISNF